VCCPRLKLSFLLVPWQHTHSGILLTWMIVCLTTAKHECLKFSLSGFTFSHVAYICSFMILYDLCLLPAQFRYVIINIQYLEIQCNSRTGVRLWNLSMMCRTLFCKHHSFKRCICAANCQAGQA
jgi:hypothetical protein